jgi:hypothetical protein
LLLEPGFADDVRQARENIDTYKRATLPNATKIMETFRPVADRDAIFR